MIVLISDAPELLASSRMFVLKLAANEIVWVTSGRETRCGQTS